MPGKKSEDRLENELRRRAESIAEGKTEPVLGEVSQVLHELQVHQIELELQNEELRRAQAELESTRARYFELYDLAPVGYCTLSDKGLILETNLTLATMLDRLRGMLVKQPLSRFIFKEDQDIFYHFRRILFETGKPQKFELRIQKEDGIFFWARLEANRTTADEGKFACRVVLSDITISKQQQEERELLARLILLLDTSGDPHECWSEMTSVLQDWSGCEAVGIRLQEGDDFPYFETRGFSARFIHEEKYLCAYGPDGNILQDGTGNPVLECMCGNILCGRFDPTKPFFTSSGSFWTNNATDLLAGTTEKDRLTRTRNRCHGEGYESIALIPLRADNKALGLLQFNDRQTNRFTPELIAQLENVASNISIALSRRVLEESLKKIEWMLSKTTSSAEERTRTSSDQAESYEDLADLNQDGLIARSIDKTILRGIASEYLDLLDTSSAIYEKNGDYALGIFSSKWCRFLENASRNLCNTDDNAEALKSGKWLCHESCWTRCSQKAIAEGEPVDVECNGGLRLYAFPVFARGEVIGSINFGYGDPPRSTGKQKEIADRYGVDFQELLRISKTYDSRPPYIIEMAKKRLQVSARLIGSLVEQKMAEEDKAKLESQLRQAQKMESVGRLAGGVAHDFNNMLCVILGHTEMALENVPPDQVLFSDLREIQKAAERSADLTRQLLAFARKQTVTPKVLDLNESVSDMLNLIERLIGENIEIDWQPGEDVWPVKIDPSQVDQILANLCVNARDSISGTGCVVIRTGNIVFDEAYSREHSDFVPGQYTTLSVSDTGCGMDSEIRDQVFEPFFTTKGVGKGTGLGLATIYGIIKQNDGYIDVESEQGKGTTFSIYLPRYEGAVEKETAYTKEKPKQGSETILVVEDEPAILAMTSEVLRRAGYNVLSAISPDDAINLARSYRGEIQVLVTDIIMPGMDGQLLAGNLRVLYPRIKLLYMSGYTSETISHQGIVDEDVLFLQKPFLCDNLLAAVQEALENDTNNE